MYGYALNSHQECVAIVAIGSRFELISGTCEYSKSMARVNQNNRLSLRHTGLRYRLMFLIGLLLVLLALLPVVVAADTLPRHDVESRIISRNIQFSTLSVDDGLSQAAVNSIVQDRQGFIWFGTQEGLNRYDGYEFAVYQKDPTEPHSLSHDWIWTLFVDNSGRLWVGTDGGG